MWKATEAFFENAAEIIGAASQSALGIMALIVIALSAISVIFFWREHPIYRLISFVFLFAGAVGIVLASDDGPGSRPIQQDEETFMLFDMPLGVSTAVDVALALGVPEADSQVRSLQESSIGLEGRFKSYIARKYLGQLPGNVTATAYMNDTRLFAVRLRYDASHDPNHSGENCSEYIKYFENWYHSETGTIHDDYTLRSSPMRAREVREGNSGRAIRFLEYSDWYISDNYFGDYLFSIRFVNYYTVNEYFAFESWADDQSRRREEPVYRNCDVFAFLWLRN